MNGWTAADIEKLEREVREPSGWSAADVFVEARRPELRKRITGRLNQAVPSCGVTDVMLTDVNFFDVN